MQIKRLIFYFNAVVAVLLLAACAAASEPATEAPAPLVGESEVASPVDEDLGAVDVAEEDVAQEAEVPEVQAEAVVEESQPVTLEPRPHRAAPAPLDEFVSDDSQFYAATGKAQLVEIFTFW